VVKRELWHGRGQYRCWGRVGRAIASSSSGAVAVRPMPPYTPGAPGPQERTPHGPEDAGQQYQGRQDPAQR